MDGKILGASGKREEWEVRRGVADNEAIWRKCSLNFDEEGHRIELDF